MLFVRPSNSAQLDLLHIFLSLGPKDLDKIEEKNWAFLSSDEDTVLVFYTFLPQTVALKLWRNSMNGTLEVSCQVACAAGASTNACHLHGETMAHGHPDQLCITLPHKSHTAYSTCTHTCGLVGSDVA